jgi:hypothetical protein
MPWDRIKSSTDKDLIEEEGDSTQEWAKRLLYHLVGILTGY